MDATATARQDAVPTDERRSRGILGGGRLMRLVEATTVLALLGCCG
jgi:hypothetical protein